MASSSPIPSDSKSIDERRLRAGLRLLMPAVPADHAAEQILTADDQLVALRALAGDLERRRTIRRLTRWFRRANVPTASSSAMRQAENIRARATLGLLLQIGSDVDRERLEDAFGVDTQDVGWDLYDARSMVGEHRPVACREFAWIIGLYRDRWLGSDDRIRLLSHLSTCDNCRLALESAQRADTVLLAAFEAELEHLPDRTDAICSVRSRRRSPTFPTAAGLIVAVVAMMVVLAGISRMTTSSAAPVPLFEGDAVEPAPLDGWLLQVSSIGSLEGLDLATGHSIGLDSGNVGGNVSVLYRVSRTHVAAWRPSDWQRDDVLTIGPIGEQVRFRLTWNRWRVYWYPSGWLDDDTLLIVKSPERIDGELEQQYIERLTTESRLIAFDAETGDEQVLMTGNIAAAFPSPDGTQLAIVQIVDHRWPGNSLEIRPFDGRSVGEAVVTIEHRIVGEGFWLPDSSRYIVSAITDEMIAMQPGNTATDLASRGVVETTLQAISRDGGSQSLATVAMPETIVPIAAAPGGRSIVFERRVSRQESRFEGVPEYDWRTYRLSLASGETELLVDGGSPERTFKPVWSPDGRTMLLPVARAFPLSTDGQVDQPINPNATTLLVFDPTWKSGTEPQVMYSHGRDLLGWLPASALEPRSIPATGAGRSLAAIDQPDALLDDIQISPETTASNKGFFLAAEQRDGSSPVIWNLKGDTVRRLPEGVSDLDWFNADSVAIGVMTDPEERSSSRIVLNAGDISGPAAHLDHRTFDPAGLGETTDRRYALPLVSPSGTSVSFFVVDPTSGHVALWLDGSHGPAAVVAEWTLPDNRLVEPNLVAIWARPDTILFAQPGDWRDGLPRVVILSRLIVDPSGVRLDELVRIGPSQGNSGVLLSELALSPDGERLAYRLRNIDDTSRDSERFDTLHMAGTDDLGRAIELDRGGHGDGLVWTSDGTGIVAGVRNRIALYSADGRDLTYLSPRDVLASFPIRLAEQIWFDVVVDGVSKTWRVDLDE